MEDVADNVDGVVLLGQVGPKGGQQGPQRMQQGRPRIGLMSCCSASMLSHGPYQLLARQAERTASRSMSTATSLLQQARLRRSWTASIDPAHPAGARLDLRLPAYPLRQPLTDALPVCRCALTQCLNTPSLSSSLQHSCPGDGCQLPPAGRSSSQCRLWSRRGGCSQPLRRAVLGRWMIHAGHGQPIARRVL